MTMLIWWFAFTLVVSAGLLFWVQPMIAKMLLPHLGGAPAVWNMCMVFFQTMLLAGYAFAHVTGQWLSLRKQILAQISLLSLGLLFLPLQLSDHTLLSIPTTADPSGWLIHTLLTTVGFPFFALATMSPMLQSWFAATKHPAAADPYFLYGASNLGSFIALAGYPLWLEPTFRLSAQSGLWGGLFCALVVLTVGCALFGWSAGRHRPDTLEKIERTNPETSNLGCPNRVSWRQRSLWVIFAFVPSSLLLGVTTYLTTDIASIPLLWVIPLSLYLLSFIVVFARRQWLAQERCLRLLPAGAIAITLVLVSKSPEPAWLVILTNLIFFFLASLICHGQLAKTRPPSAELTEFYLWLSVGGVAGGWFNSLIAPVLFNRVVEYPLMIVVICWLRVLQKDTPAAGPRSLLGLDLAYAVALGIFTAALAIMVPFFDLPSAQANNLAIFALPLLLGFTMVDRPWRFAFGLGAIMLGGAFYSGLHGITVQTHRNFFGVTRVTIDPTRSFRQLIHGNTVHGVQGVDANRRDEPTAYYHRDGPLGAFFQVANGLPLPPQIAVIGLGVGSMISYAKTNQTWTFFEIDPEMIRLAQDPKLFTYLHSHRHIATRILPGDARLQLRRGPDSYYGILVLDAFSSDAIPVHLLTREAMDLYLAKLAPGGLLLLHISNRYLELEPLVANLAKRAGLVCVAWDDMNEIKALGKLPSHWVAMARREADFGLLLKNASWLPLKASATPKVWTDDFSNLWGLFKWH